jgi:hypothetical protein
MAGIRAVKHWWFSLSLLVAYLLTFQLWLAFPNRIALLVIGSLAVVAMMVAMRQATRRGYFADRSDWFLHGLVIVDVALETASFEAFNAASMCVFCTPGDVSRFHSNYNFCWCSVVLGVLVGGYHGWALHRGRGSGDCGQSSVAIRGDGENPTTGTAHPIASSATEVQSTEETSVAGQ